LATQSILSSSGAVGDVVDVLDSAVAEQQRQEALERVRAAENLVATYSLARTQINIRLKNLRSAEQQLLRDIGAEISDLAGEESDGIVAALDTLMKIRTRLSVHSSALAVTVETKLPEATAKLRRAEGDLKMRAADVIDSRRWHRLRAHADLLNALVESEGDTEVRPQRFEAEGEIANQMRTEGMRLIEQAEEIERTLKGK